MSILHTSIKEIPKTLTFAYEIPSIDIAQSEAAFWSRLDRLSVMIDTSLKFPRHSAFKISSDEVFIKQKLVEFKMDYTCEEDFRLIRSVLIKSLLAELDKTHKSQDELLNFIRCRINLIHLFNWQEYSNLNQMQVEPPFLSENHLDSQARSLQDISTELNTMKKLLMNAENAYEDVDAAIKLCWEMNAVLENLNQCCKSKHLYKTLTMNTAFQKRYQSAAARLFFHPNG